MYLHLPAPSLQGMHVGATRCPECELDISDRIVICPRCGKAIWPNVQKDLFRRLKQYLITIGACAMVGSIVGVLVARTFHGAMLGAAGGVIVSFFLFTAGLLLGLGDR